jgi:hypothetical protein
MTVLLKLDSCFPFALIFPFIFPFIRPITVGSRCTATGTHWRSVPNTVQGGGGEEIFHQPTVMGLIKGVRSAGSQEPMTVLLKLDSCFPFALIFPFIFPFIICSSQRLLTVVCKGCHLGIRDLLFLCVRSIGMCLSVLEHLQVRIDM